MKGPRVAAALGVLVLAAACSRSPGTISGHLYMVGGPTDMQSPMPGTVYVTGHGSVHAGPDGSFSINVPTGTYTLTARSSQINGGQDLCAKPRTVTVVPHDFVQVNLICDVP